MKLKATWSSLHEQTARFKGADYSVAEIVDLAKDIESQEAPIDAFAMDYGSPCEDSLISFAEHCLQVDAADLSYPIILSPCGVIVDGRHRLIKSLVTGAETIVFKRLAVLPRSISESKGD